MGDGLAGLTVLIGVQMPALTTRRFFGFNVALIVAWLLFTVILIREYRKAGRENESTIN